MKSKPKKVCDICKKGQASSYKKSLCHRCTEKIVNEESSSLLDNIRLTTQRSEYSTRKKDRPPSPVPSSTSRLVPRSTMQPSSVSSGEYEEELISAADSDEGSRCPLFLSEETGHHLKAVRSTMGIEVIREPRFVPDHMFQGLDCRRTRVFPLHSNLKKLIPKEWANLGKKSSCPQLSRENIPLVKKTLLIEIKCQRWMPQMSGYLRGPLICFRIWDT